MFRFRHVSCVFFCYISNGSTDTRVLFADVAKLVDALDLGSSAVRHGGSSPSIRTLQSLDLDQVPIGLRSRLGVFVIGNFKHHSFGNYIRQARCQ